MDKEYKKKYNKEYQKTWRLKNPEYCKEYYKKHHKEYQKYNQEYRKRNLEYYKEYNKEYYKCNKEKIKEHYKEYNKEYVKQRKKIDPQFKLNKNIGTQICKCLKGNKNGKHWEDLVGYTLQELKARLESLFYLDEKICWNNYGSYWHVDHIKSKFSFNFTKPEDKEFKECWALSNLQPLEGIENIKKSNK